mmetsp:Transcript_125950/g.251335  ORF Transcript_125950/g.251335 Transcript_125950/m.251335 type:complete len:257 (-) Transcript_125950:20-790(-)
MQSAKRSWTFSKRTADLQHNHVQLELLRNHCMQDIQAGRRFATHFPCQLHQLYQSTAQGRHWSGTKQLLALQTIQAFAQATFRDLLGLPAPLVHGSARSKVRCQTSRPASLWVGRMRAGMSTQQHEAGVARRNGPRKRTDGAEPLWKFPYLMEATMVCRMENLFRHHHHLFRSRRHTRQDPGSAGLALQDRVKGCSGHKHMHNKWELLKQCLDVMHTSFGCIGCCLGPASVDAVCSLGNSRKCRCVRIQDAPNDEL